MGLRFWRRAQDDVEAAPIDETPPEWLSKEDPRRKKAERDREKTESRQSILGWILDVVGGGMGEAGLVLGGVALVGAGLFKAVGWLQGRPQRLIKDRVEQGLRLLRR